MRSTAKILSVALLAMAPVLVGKPALAGDTSTPQTTPTTTGLSLHLVTLSLALKLGMDFQAEPYLKLGSSACGSLQVKASSACDLSAPPDCMTGCDPQNFASAAYSDCHPGCTAAATSSCKSACTSSCKSVCLSDCEFDPVIACENGCASDCEATCADLEANGGVDPVGCAIACDSTCSKACADVAAVSNIDNCGVQCSESCDSECAADENMACEVGCQVAVIEDETSGCKNGCYAEGSLTCDGKPAPAMSDILQCVDLLKSLGVKVTPK
jgi:hypothetical protein